MKKSEKKRINGQFMKAATSYIQNRGMAAEVEGEHVRCGVVFGPNGYDVSLHCDPGGSRFYCNCLIRNVFPEEKRAEVIRLLTLLTQSCGKVGGRLGISRSAGDLHWETYCEAPGHAIDESLIHEVVTVGVGKFNDMVLQVRDLVAGRLPWSDTNEDGTMLWN